MFVLDVGSFWLRRTEPAHFWITQQLPQTHSLFTKSHINRQPPHQVWLLNCKTYECSCLQAHISTKEYLFLQYVLYMYWNGYWMCLFLSEIVKVCGCLHPPQFNITVPQCTLYDITFWDIKKRIIKNSCICASVFWCFLIGKIRRSVALIWTKTGERNRCPLVGKYNKRWHHWRSPFWSK